MTIPTASDINVYNSLDERSACANFLGKTFEEAVALFQDNALLYQEDLMWMGPTAFRFYTPAFTRYLTSDNSCGDSDALNTFVGLIEWRLQHYRNDVIAIRPGIEWACRQLLDRYASFEIDESIYGDLRVGLRAIASALSGVATDD